MNTANVSNIMLATIIIDVNGQIRTLAAGETPKPGEVIVELGEDLTSSEGIQVQLVETSGEANNISVDNEIAQLIEQIQAGEDPTQNPDLATAAGQNGSSPTGTGTVERTGAELLASTSFDTSGLESQGLSETQSLSLLELVSESLVVFEGTNLFEYFENSSVDDVLAVVNLELLEGEVPQYSIQFQPGDPLEGLFEINAQGEIHLTQEGVASFANDFELDANQHTITVLVTVGDQVTPIEITLSELDVDEPPVFVPPTDGDSYVFSYNENSLDSTVIGQVSATDPEAQTVSYSIAYGESDPLDGLFEINAEGEISLTAAGVTAFTNDYELASNIHNITVVATDPAGNSNQISVTLNELDINEPPVFVPPTEGDSYVFSYNENSFDSTVIGQVSASDPEAQTVSYSIAYGDNDPLDGLFEINAEGEISLTTAGVTAFTNDYELASNTHNITVVATDPAGNSNQISVTLNELDINEPPVFVPPTEGDSYVFSYNENSLDSTVIGQVSATDPEAQTVSYSIAYGESDPLDGLFEINDEGEISLTAAGVTAFTNDYELASNIHNITVVATDPAGNSSQIAVTLNELDINEPPVFVPPTEGDSYVFIYNENSLDSTVIGQVSASDPEAQTVSYSIAYGDNDPLDGLFEINAEGEISLTAAGVTAFTNDYELASNIHNITVVATDPAGNSSQIAVTLNELDINEPPVFVPPTEGDSYVFSYNENSLDSTVIGQVSASDPEAQTVSYSIAYGDNDPLDGLFEINAEGKISLTAVGVKAFTNDYELTSNTHNITVVATDPAGNSSQIAVTLNEININERPLAENFSVDIADQDIVPIVFDTTGSDDHISDVDDDMLGNQVMVMLTSLPDAGTLLYTEGGVTREITESDLYDSQSGYLGTEFDPNFISYVPGSKNLFTFGDSDHSNMEDGQWGDPNEDNTVRTYTLDNDNVITLWITDQNGKPATFHLYKNENANDGYGLADNDGNGINGNGGQSDNGHETFHIDLAQNPLDVVYFGIDGVGGAQNGNSDNSIMVTYHLYDGNSETVNYEKPDGDVGNQQLSYEFSYSSPDNPIIGIEMTGDGGSWVLSYFSGAEALPDETSFTYVAIDSGVPVDENNTQTKLISDEATVTLDTSDAPSYNVFSAENGDSLNGQLGNDVLIGDEQANIFTWLDSTLDSGRDVIVDFELGNDKVDLLDILSDSPSTQEFNALIDSISVSVSGDNVELEVPINQDDSQTIVFENGASLFDSYIDSGAITQQNDLLNALLKDPSS